jgi:carboxyl-terminal processing protease
VSVPNVPYSGMVSDNVGYVALTTFTREAGRNVGNALKKLKEENENLKGIILDLRGNGGGLLAEAVNVSNVFIPKSSLIVTTKGKVKDWDRSFKTLNKPIDEDINLAVLINHGSASASEIVSGVIQDFDRGVLIGQRSYGKGLVQNTRDIGYNSKVKMTTAKYYIPSGRCIQSVEYMEGEPADIPDDKRAKFKTQNGRQVLDGGGVSPDIIIDEDADSDILKTLSNKHLIFKFVTEFVLKNESVSSVEEFNFTDWDGFVQYLAKNNFDYNTESEKLLKELKGQAEKDGYIVTADIETLENKIIEAKKNDLNNNKEAIIDMIEKEIASRYFYEKGKIEIGLRNDIEIKQAVSLLNNDTEYKKALNKAQ